MRKLIAGMKISLDQSVVGPEGYADWVDAWSEDYGLTAQIDACLLGAGMFPGYEGYWTAVLNAPHAPLPMTGKAPTPDELKWARFIPEATHYVLSRTLGSSLLPNVRFIRSADEVSALKQLPGKDIYLIGGARTTSSLLDAGLVDELRLIVHPLIAGGGDKLFAAAGRRRELELHKVQQLADGRLGLSYAVS